MPINLEKALGAQLPPVTSRWSADDVILYHLGLGAGLGISVDPSELGYTYEGCLKVLPTFAVIPSSNAVPDMDLNSFPGIEIDLRCLLHAQQETIVHGSVPTAGDISSTARVAEIWDKGNAAIIVLEVESADLDGTVLFTNRSSLFVRGEGGFGGERGSSAASAPPDREPDAVFESRTMPNQALVYRLSGDRNPIHADPSFAKAAGLDAPILHGLCTYGVVAKAVVDGLLGGDVTTVQQYRARFAGVVLPGETIVTRAWRESDRIVVDAHVKERGTPALADAAIVVR